MEGPGRAEADLADVRRRKLAATQRLLGDTITISESDWREPVALPGWTRGHVATHVARNADRLRFAAEAVKAGRPHEPGPDAHARQRELETGARRTPLDLQIDLDTSAARLNVTFDSLDEEQWGAPAPDGAGRMLDLPMARLNEVVLHHVDLDCGFGFSDVDPVVAIWLLGWNAARLSPRLGETTLELVSDGRTRAVVGTGAAPVTRVTGSDAALLGWLTGRLDDRSVEGADQIGLDTPL